MSAPADDEFKLLLARAFDRAWKRYYRPSRVGAISASVARPALAKHLIAIAKEGLVSADALAEGGLLHLVSLTPETRHWGHLGIKGAEQGCSRCGEFGCRPSPKNDRRSRERPNSPSGFLSHGGLALIVRQLLGLVHPFNTRGIFNLPTRPVKLNRAPMCIKTHREIDRTPLIRESPLPPESASAHCLYSPTTSPPTRHRSTLIPSRNG